MGTRALISTCLGYPLLHPHKPQGLRGHFSRLEGLLKGLAHLMSSAVCTRGEHAHARDMYTVDMHTMSTTIMNILNNRHIMNMQ